MRPSLGLALVVSVLAGVVLAGLAFPLIGGIGLIAKAGADDFLALPGRRPCVLAQSSTILDKDGHVLATLFTENRRQRQAAHVPLVTPAGAHRDRGQPLLRAPRHRREGHVRARWPATPAPAASSRAARR